jgi:hypothetical protein
MIPDINIWRCAQLIIDSHGDEPAIEARQWPTTFRRKAT